MDSSVDALSTLLGSLLLPLMPVEASHPPRMAMDAGIHPLIEIARISEIVKCHRKRPLNISKVSDPSETKVWTALCPSGFDEAGKPEDDYRDE